MSSSYNRTRNLLYTFPPPPANYTSNVAFMGVATPTCKNKSSPLFSGVILDLHPGFSKLDFRGGSECGVYRAVLFVTLSGRGLLRTA